MGLSPKWPGNGDGACEFRHRMEGGAKIGRAHYYPEWTEPHSGSGAKRGT